jgi:calreticulin
MLRALSCSGWLILAHGKIYFQETFSDDTWESRWVKSKWKENEGTHGKWNVSTGKWVQDKLEDRGLQTSEDSKHFTISTKIDPPVNTADASADKNLIIQYQVQFSQVENQRDECHGGSMKLGTKMEDPTQFGENTPFHIMFGPDTCGYTRRTYATFSFDGKPVLKKHDLHYYQRQGKTHLYRLVFQGNARISIEVDEREVWSGHLHEGWELEIPKEIVDPKDKKPKNWVDEARIEDDREKKPDTWVDERRIPDKKAVKPHDWDDESDGQWEIPFMDNPAWKGVWRPHRILNPAFKGYWEPRRIPNPEYKVDEKMGHYELGWLGFDLWQVQGGTHIDNIIITDNHAEADAFSKKWRDRQDFEQVQLEKEKEVTKLRHQLERDAQDDDDEDIWDMPDEFWEEFDDDQMKTVWQSLMDRDGDPSQFAPGIGASHPFHSGFGGFSSRDGADSPPGGHEL